MGCVGMKRCRTMRLATSAGRIASRERLGRRQNKAEQVVAKCPSLPSVSHAEQRVSRGGLVASERHLMNAPTTAHSAHVAAANTLRWQPAGSVCWMQTKKCLTTKLLHSHSGFTSNSFRRSQQSARDMGPNPLIQCERTKSACTVQATGLLPKALSG